MSSDAWSLPHLGEFDPSALILVSLAVVAAVAWAFLKLGVIRFVLALFSKAVRHSVYAGFTLWRWSLSWALLPYFAVAVAALLLLGWLAGERWPWVELVSGAVLLSIGVVTCLAYMFIDLERYEVGRGYKALHNPLKGQELATNLVRYGPQVGIPYGQKTQTKAISMEDLEWSGA